MIDFIATGKTNGRPVVHASCLPGFRSERTRLSAPALLGTMRPTKAPAVAAEACAYAFAVAAEGAGDGRQKTQHHMWAFRGLEPWRDPA